MCADGKTAIFKCFVILANNPYTYIGLCDTRCKKCWDVSFFFFPPELLAFYSQDWRVRGRRFIKIYFGLKPKILTTPWRRRGEKACCLQSREECHFPATPSPSRVLIGTVHHLNLDAQLVHSVTDEAFIHLYKYNWHNKFAANREPVAVWQEVRCRAEYTWDTYPHLSLISELLLQLSQPSMPQNELFISPQQGKFPFQSVK